MVFASGDNNDDVEDDSILTQILKDAEDEGDMDMTLPLESHLQTNDTEDDDSLSKTLIPQLDGECDDSRNVSKILYALQPK